MNLMQAETSEELQMLAMELFPVIGEFNMDLVFNEKLFQRVKVVYEKRDKIQMTPEQSTLLEKKYKTLTRMGALLDAEALEKFREIDKELNNLTLKFDENLLAETNKYQLHVTDERRFKGVPSGVIQAAREFAKSKNLEGLVFTLDYPSFAPLLHTRSTRSIEKK